METVTKHNTYAQRRFGQWKVTIIGHIISIIGDWHSNHGIIYTHMIDKWRSDPEHVQIIGMDNTYGITKRTLGYIHWYVRKHAETLQD